MARSIRHFGRLAFVFAAPTIVIVGCSPCDFHDDRGRCESYWSSPPAADDGGAGGGAGGGVGSGAVLPCTTKLDCAKEALLCQEYECIDNVCDLSLLTNDHPPGALDTPEDCRSAPYCQAGVEGYTPEPEDYKKNDECRVHSCVSIGDGSDVLVPAVTLVGKYEDVVGMCDGDSTCNGQGTCAKKPTKSCTDPIDCASGICEQMTCLKDTYELCSSHADCASSDLCDKKDSNGLWGVCLGGEGAKCTSSEECTSQLCKVGKCVLCNDDVLETTCDVDYKCYAKCLKTCTAEKTCPEGYGFGECPTSTLACEAQCDDVADPCADGFKCVAAHCVPDLL
jgi:hypothetical protein